MIDTFYRVDQAVTADESALWVQTGPAAPDAWSRAAGANATKETTCFVYSVIVVAVTSGG
jgi:hypothetical protein